MPLSIHSDLISDYIYSGQGLLCHCLFNIVLAAINEGTKKFQIPLTMKLVKYCRCMWMMNCDAYENKASMFWCWSYTMSTQLYCTLHLPSHDHNITHHSLPIFKVTVMIFNDIVDSVIVLNEVHWKKMDKKAPWEMIVNEICVKTRSTWCAKHWKPCYWVTYNQLFSFRLLTIQVYLIK